MLYNYSISADTLNQKIAIGKLTNDIRSSSISIALDTISTSGDALYINFRNSINSSELDILNNLISHHDGIPTYKPKILTIVENKSQTQGIYQIHSTKFTIPAYTEVSKITIMPYPIRLLDLEFKSKNDGDRAKAIINEDTLIGGLTVDINTNDTIINVTDTVLRSIGIGFDIKLDNGSYSYIGIVISIDLINKQLILNNPIVNSFSTINTQVKMTISLTHGYLELIANHEYKCGEKVIGGLLLDANTPLKMSYYNNSDISINIIFYMEYWF